LRREENWRTRRKTLKARERINNKLNSHVTLSPGIEHEIAVVRGKHLAAMPPMLPMYTLVAVSNAVVRFP
jgi:hypothetical protein